MLINSKSKGWNNVTIEMFFLRGNGWRKNYIHSGSIRLLCVVLEPGTSREKRGPFSAMSI